MAEHPYDYGSYDNWAALQALLNYRLARSTNLSRAYPLWTGEIECHPTANGGATTQALEEQYVAAVLRAAYTNHYGFASWKYSTFDNGSNADDVITQSGYVPRALGL